MRSSTLAASAVFLSALSLVNGQTFTDCDPTKKSCPADPGLAGKLSTDFTKGKSSDWALAAGTTLSYDGGNGAVFTIGKKTDAPTISSDKYIMFGKVDVVMRASAGTGTVSSFILESDDLDEIDWEWLGSTDTSVETNFFGKGNTTTYDRAIYHPMSDPINSFHTYTIDWTAQSIKWSIDGAQVRELLFADPLALGGRNYPQTPMRIKMGNWIGCIDAAAATDPKSKGTCDWAGGPIDLTKGPYNMYVKSVSIEDYGCGTSYAFGDMTGSYQSIQSSPKCDGSNGGSSSKSSSQGSSSTTSGPILIETSASGNTTSTVSSGSASATTFTKVSGSATGTGSGGSASGTGSGSATNPSSTGSSTSSSSPQQASTNAAPRTKYGALDVAVMGLGLGLGYLVM